MRTHTLGRGGFGVSIDEAGCLRDLWFPETGGENHLVGNRCALGLGLGDRVVWTHDPGWEMESRPVEAGRRAWTRLHHPQSGVTLLLLDELTPDGDGLMRHVRWLDSAEIRRLPRALYFHFDLQLMESDLAGCVRYEPDGRFLRHFKRQRQVLVGALRDGIPGIEEWTLGRRDENEGAGIRPDAARAELPRNPVAMGAGESLVALRAAADTSFPAITQVLLVATNEAELRTRWTRCLASYRHADPVAPLVARPDPVRALRSEALGLIASQCGIGGAILASTDGEILESARDSYAWCWPRDGAFVASALEMSGETGIPGRFYEYCRRALHPAGYLQQRYHADGSPGSTWHRAPHPDELWLPIQEDETALVLWALGESVHRSSRALYRELVLPAAEFLDHYRDEATRLPRPSHDLWEERFGVHTFTVLAVIAGLEASSRIARLHDDPGHEQAWSKAAAEVATAFERHFFHEDEGRYARMAYPQPDGDLHLDMTVDAALSGLFLFDEGRASQERTRQTMDAVEDRLRVRTAVGGLARYEGDRYCARHDARADLPGNPWILTSLWMADWHLLRSSDDDGLARADAWIAWAARQATDAGLLPEQLDARTGEHLSVRPLTWSHSTFLSTSIKRDRLASKLRARAKI